MAQNWFDIIPAIPAQYGVPLVERLMLDDHSIVSDRRGLYCDGHVIVCASRAGTTFVGLDPCMQDHKGDAWVVNLDDPQGFGYALRFACLACWDGGDLVRPPGDLPRLTRMWGQGSVTDADRIVLAKALKEACR